MCEVGLGKTALFWFDNWRGLGPLIDVTGEKSPAISSLTRSASVRDAISENGWWLSRSRSRNPVIAFLINSLPDHAPILNAKEDDTYKWIHSTTVSSGIFSTSETWKALHLSGEEVFWHEVIWFQGRIPKHAFLSWIVVRDRLVTRDRLFRWGLLVPESCVLCTGGNESRQHLFFIVHSVERYGLSSQILCIFRLPICLRRSLDG